MSHPGLLLLGITFLAGVWWGPFAELGRHAFYAHMTIHMIIVAVAAPLLAFGLAGGSWDPLRRWPGCASPLIASLFEFAVVWLWHMPLLHDSAGSNASAMAAEQGSFLFSGFVFWISIFGGEPARRIERGAAGITALLLTLMHMTLLGALLALSPRPLYAGHHADGMDALFDQQLGGVIMIAASGVAYMAAALWLAARLLLRARPH